MPLATGGRLHRIFCRYVIHYLAPAFDWLSCAGEELGDGLEGGRLWWGFGGGGEAEG